MTFHPMLLMEILFGCAILGYAIWQVVSLSPKRIAAEEAKQQAEREKAGLEKSSGHTEG
jgi:hypothetical protein